MDPDQLAERAGVDSERLQIEFRREELLYGGDSWGIVVVRRGWLAAERYTFNVATTTRFDIWSATKSVTALGWGLLLEDCRHGISLDTRVYDLMPAGTTLSDERKRLITVGHVLSMTSGIRGESSGIYGMPSSTEEGVFEFALGLRPNRYGMSTAELAGAPGTSWDYSDPGYCHLAMAFPQASGEHLGPYVERRILSPIGIQGAGWEWQGGRGFLGPYTNAHTGFVVSARELARLGYLVLRGGTWGGDQIIPEAWLRAATRPSQPYQPGYGYGWWTNREGHFGNGLPRDLIAMSGYRGNRCYIVPSQDLVIARVGGGPAAWDESGFLPRMLEALR